MSGVTIGMEAHIIVVVQLIIHKALQRAFTVFLEAAVGIMFLTAVELLIVVPIIRPARITT